MKAMLLSAPGVLEYVDAPHPGPPGADEVVMRVRAASVCGSDTHGYTGQGGRRVPPLIMGHEASGEVAELGSGVDSLRVGDRILMLPQIICMKGEPCLVGAFDQCLHRKVPGADLPGAFAEYVRIPARNALPLPDNTSFLQASLLEPLSVVVGGLSRVSLLPGATAAVVGAGPIGLIAVGVLALTNPRELIVFEPQPSRRQLAMEMGATLALDPKDPGVLDEVRRRTGGLGVDVCVEAAGITPTVATAVDVTRAGGSLVWLGNAGRTVEIDEFKVVWNQLNIHASLGVTRRSAQAALSILATGKLDIHKIVSLSVPLSEGVAAFHRTAQDPTIIKTVILP
jgi:L-iditol 2-dehydrogenase